jgi:hypothetical protein
MHYIFPQEESAKLVFPWTTFSIMLTPILRQFTYGPAILLHVNLLYSSYMLSWYSKPVKLISFCAQTVI